MSLSIQKMVSDGTLSTIVLGVQYLQRNDMYVRIAGVKTPQSGAPSGYTWSFLDNNTIRVLPIVPAGVEVVVYRRTDLDAMYNIYSQNAQFDESTIDENNQQLLYIAQEYFEQGVPAQLIDNVEYVREDTTNMYYRLKLSDGSYTAEFPIPKGGAAGFEALRRSYAEAGLNLVDGSFEEGGTLTSSSDVLLHKVSGIAYSGPIGSVAARTDPTVVGSGYVSRRNVVLRDELAGAGGAALVGYQRSLPVGYSGTVQDFINDIPGVNIWEFASLVTIKPTPDNPATWDWTPAFVAAINTGRKIVVPEGTYIGGDITPDNGLVLIGSGGESSKTLLKVKAGAAGFLTPNTSSSDYYDVVISGVAVTAEDNSSSFWKQSSNEYYTAYAYFHDVNIYQNVQCGFSGFFIFTEWYKCRSGYNGVGAVHSFISSVPAAFGQYSQTNLCQVNACRLFNSKGNPMVDIAYGARWDFNHTDFEGCATVAIRARGIYGGKINGGWLERCSGQYVLDFDVSPAPNSQGSRPWEVSHTFVNLDGSPGVFAHVYGASDVRINNTVFIHVPTGVVLKSGGGSLYVDENVGVISGDASSFWNQSLPTASIFPNGNPLPFGEYGVEATYLTNNGFLSVANGESYIDPVNHTARLTLSANANAAYYMIPTKVLPLLRGKKVRVKAIGSFVSATGGDVLSIGVWDSVTTPSYFNSTSALDLAPTWTTDMASATVDVTVGAAATSFALGVRVGGGATGAVFVLESISMQVL